jgi:hypothetical protein
MLRIDPSTNRSLSRGVPGVTTVKKKNKQRRKDEEEEEEL